MAWEKFVSRYPKTSLTFFAFAAIAGGFITNNPYIAIGIFSGFSIANYQIYAEKKRFYETLLTSISDKQENFNTILKNTTFNLFDGVLLYLAQHPVGLISDSNYRKRL